MSQLLASLVLAGLLGMIGQGARAVVGLKGMADQTADPTVAAPGSFSAARLSVSLVIGFIAGALAGLALGIDTMVTPLSKDLLLGLIAAGYAGTDFIEGFMSKYLPAGQPAVGGQVQAASLTPRAMVASAFQGISSTVQPAALTSLLQAAPALPSAQDKVKTACETEWDAHKADCSGFVRAVALELGASVTGDANQIAAALRAGAPWQQLADGPSAASAALEGKFVVGGLAGSDQAIQDAHGHVVVVVQGPLNRGKYPTAYWGSLGGTPAKNQTVNWAWTTSDRDKVVYASFEP